MLKKSFLYNNDSTNMKLSQTKFLSIITSVDFNLMSNDPSILFPGLIKKLILSHSKLRLSRPRVNKNVLKSLLFHEYQVHVQTGTKIMHLIVNTSSILDEFFLLSINFTLKYQYLTYTFFHWFLTWENHVLSSHRTKHGHVLTRDLLWTFLILLIN